MATPSASTPSADYATYSSAELKPPYFFLTLFNKSYTLAAYSEQTTD